MNTDDRFQLLELAYEIRERIELLECELGRPSARPYRAQDHLEFARQRIVEMQETIGRLVPDARIGSRG